MTLAAISVELGPPLDCEEEEWLLALADMENWTAPEFSRNQADRAGDVLRGTVTPGDEALWVYRVINNWRQSHDFPLARIRLDLRRHARRVQKTALVVGRIKRLQSVREKLRTNDTMDLTQIQDIGGCRAVMKSMAEVNRLLEIYKERNDFEHMFRWQSPYIDNPKPTGYRSHHLIYQFQNTPGGTDVFNKHRVEMQIRTRLQHAWATAVETVGMFTGHALKANVGDQDWLRLFALMSSEFAEMEGTAVVPGTPERRSDRVYEIRHLAKQLRAVQTLDAYSHAVYELGHFEKHARYFLLQYDYKANKIYAEGFFRGEIKTANAWYEEAEKEATARNRNVVLVSADSLDQLRSAYPNYFLDAGKFTNHLWRVIQK
ncbi:RelA/SpoT domain-containing protein [Microvirga terricola]|uniref:RelA/SpoT domain-containing protein n=1 Tax=Microvirga terricola TaxID=2719797 RepID=A0ABX0VBJ3_9HYPH|nr:RelA/SpoT domain-containing protein [Microvirga terricola]NIX77068.1 hypothetical protein [Microvirga terricola]